MAIIYHDESKKSTISRRMQATLKIAKYLALHGHLYHIGHPKQQCFANNKKSSKVKDPAHLVERMSIQEIMKFWYNDDVIFEISIFCIN
jgi:hypothetical protein